MPVTSYNAAMPFMTMPYANPIPYASQYLKDPTISNPSVYPPGPEKSRLIGTSNRMIDDRDMEIIPPPPVIPLQLPGCYDISKDDEIAFIKLGIKDDI